MTLTITKIGIYDKKTQAGKPYKQVALKCQEYGDKWVSGFLQPNDPRADWKAGQQVEWEVKQNGQWLNMVDPPKQTAGTLFKEIKEQMDRIEGKLDTIIKGYDN